MMLLVAILTAAILSNGLAAPDDDKRYVGTETCRSCHEEQYEHFSKFARKAHSYDSVKIMQKGLTVQEVEDCYKCHTTGYGKPGGFVSETETPEMKNNGCEVCHGPGSLHAESEDPEDIIYDVEMESCMVCHNSERVADFNFKPLLHAGAH